MKAQDRQVADRKEKKGAVLSAALSGRSISSYLLLIFPLMLLLSLHTFLDAARPARFAFGLLCLFVFLAIALQRAVMDLLDILREHLRETRLAYQETLGEEDFVHDLANRVHLKQGGE